MKVPWLTTHVSLLTFYVFVFLGLLGFSIGYLICDSKLKNGDAKRHIQNNLKLVKYKTMQDAQNTSTKTIDANLERPVGVTMPSGKLNPVLGYISETVTIIVLC